MCYLFAPSVANSHAGILPHGATKLQALHMHQLARTKAEEEERIAAVLQQRMHDSERKTKELQQLRNESAELRDLQVRTPAATA